jgi:inhibitor of KinA sporulation pathway (predicted exonuclease)
MRQVCEWFEGGYDKQAPEGLGSLRFFLSRDILEKSDTPLAALHHFLAELERVERRSILVRTACSTVSAYCTQLTTLTQADVDAGIPLAEVCRVLTQEYQSGQRLFASFGDYDRQQFERNCAAFGIPYPFGPTHLNVKNLAAVAYGWSREVGMSEALKRARLPLEGTHHRGGDDAWNIAGLLCHLLRRIRE